VKYIDQKASIIIVEDDRDLRESIVEFLVWSGHDVCGVGSCQEFVNAVTASPFSIALVDLGLPDQSGYTLVEYIRRNTTMGVIILTARNSVEDRVHGYDAGADLYMVKPIDCRELSAAVTNLTARLGDRIFAADQASNSGSWRLVRSAWYLLTPTGIAIMLTGKEMSFLTCLVEADGSPVERIFLLEALGYRNDEYAHRAMDSLVRRLRRKIEKKCGRQAPIMTVNTIGYSFSSSITIS
jgi:DNA-binding response OmpR family regulator